MTFITAHSNTVADRTDTEIKAACFVLKTEGDWQDDWIVCQIEQALEPFELGVAE